MNSMVEKRSFFTSKYGASPISDVEKYEKFFPKFTGNHYNQFLVKQERVSPSSSGSSRFSFIDDGLSNASSSFSSEEDSPGCLAFRGSSFTSIFEQTKKFLKTPQKSSCKRQSPRKPLKPMKSVHEGDPDFQGVTLQIKPKMTKGKHEQPQSQLVIDCAYSAKKKKKRNTSPSSRVRSCSPKLNPAIYKLGQSPSYLSMDPCYDPDLGVAPLHLGKECASCGVGKTPLWRDAEDGTPLCNACGIRYKKYRLRCLKCWYIPKKEEKALPCCPCCGHTFKVTVTRRGSITD